MEKKQVKELIDRLELFIKILANDMQLRELTKEQEARLWGQITAYGSAVTLIKQSRKRGSIWKGGYLDNVGVVYADQVQEHYEKQLEALKAKAN